jgi:hypothetical protein
MKFLDRKREVEVSRCIHYVERRSFAFNTLYEKNAAISAFKT